MVRKIQAKLVLRLHAQGLSGRAIARSQGMSRRSVSDVLDAARAVGVGWDDVAGKTDGEVYALLFPGRGERESVYEQPDWARVHRELARVGVTLGIPHGEYVDGCRRTGKPHMGYDRFCKLYAAYVQKLGVTSRVGHKAGRAIEVDWPARPCGSWIRSPGIRQRRICSWPCCRSAGTRSWNPRSTWRRTRGCGPMWRCTSGSAVPRPAWCATI